MIDWMCSSSFMALQVKNQHNVWEQCWVPSGNLNNMPLGFPFLDHTNFDDSTLLFCKGQLRNVHSFKMHMPSYCSAHWIFCLVLVAFAVVICSRSLMSVNFQFDTVKIQVNDSEIQLFTSLFVMFIQWNTFFCLWKNPLVCWASESQNLPAWSHNPLAPGLLYPTNWVCNINNVSWIWNPVH